MGHAAVARRRREARLQGRDHPASWPTSRSTSSRRSCRRCRRSSRSRSSRSARRSRCSATTPPLQLTDLPVGVLVVFACSSLGVYGIVLSGWASGSTYPLLGGLRSAAQMISYEVAMGLSMVARVPVLRHHVDLGHRRPAQHHLWNVIPLFVSFVHLRHLGGRRDQPRAVRPGRGRVRARRRFPHRVLVVQVRDVLPGRVHQHGHRLGAGHDAVPRRLARTVADLAVARRQLRLVADALVHRQGRSPCIFVFVWLRGTLPRLRYDQFMALGWKVLIPINLVWILAVTAIHVLRDRGWPAWQATARRRSASCCVVIVDPGADDLARARPARARPPTSPRTTRTRRSWTPTFPIPPMDLRRPDAAAPARHRERRPAHRRTRAAEPARPVDRWETSR